MPAGAAFNGANSGTSELDLEKDVLPNQFNTELRDPVSWPPIPQNQSNVDSKVWVVSVVQLPTTFTPSLSETISSDSLRSLTACSRDDIYGYGPCLGPCSRAMQPFI